MTHVVQKKVYRAYGDLLHMVSACFLRACRQGHLEIAMFFILKLENSKNKNAGVDLANRNHFKTGLAVKGQICLFAQIFTTILAAAARQIF